MYNEHMLLDFNFLLIKVRSNWSTLRCGNEGKHDGDVIRVYYSL